MNLEQFKNMLIKAIYQHLHTVSKDEHFYLPLNLPNAPDIIGLTLSPDQWRLIHDFDAFDEKPQDNRSLKLVYSSLLKSIIEAEQGYNLWYDIQARIKAMPSKWQIFAPLRPLHIALNNVLNEFKPSELKEEDDSVFKKLINAFIEEIKNLKDQITNLTKKCTTLEELFNKSTEDAFNKLQEKYNVLEKKKDNYLKKYKDVQALRLQEIQNNEIKTKELQDLLNHLTNELTNLAQENHNLKQIFSARTNNQSEMQQSKQEPNLEQELRPGKIEYGDSQALMQLHNQKFRGRRPPSSNGKASQLGLYQNRFSPKNDDDRKDKSPDSAHRPS